MKPLYPTIQIKAIEHVALFVMLHKVVLTFKSLNETVLFGSFSNVDCSIEPKL